MVTPATENKEDIFNFILLHFLLEIIPQRQSHLDFLFLIEIGLLLDRWFIHKALLDDVMRHIESQDDSEVLVTSYAKHHKVRGLESKHLVLSHLCFLKKYG